MMECRQKGNELIYKECPFCGNTRWNFQLNVDLKVFHCWVCGEKGPITRLNILLPSVFHVVLEQTLTTTTPKTLVLEESMDVIGTPGEVYLKERGFQLSEIIGWRIKYSKRGKLLFPLYDRDDNLIYYVEKELATGRWYYPAGVSKKDIVWAKVTFKNDTILLVEGLMDAVKVYSYGYNVMVLLGTHIFEGDVLFMQQRKLRPVLFLDGDCKIDVYKRIQRRLPDFDYMKITNDKDPDELSKEEVDTLYNQRTKFSLGSELLIKWGK